MIQHVQMPHQLGERLNKEKLLPVDKLVYVYMRKYADKEGITFVSIEKLATECGVNPRTVSNSILRLLKAQELYLLEDKIGRSKKYQFNMSSERFEMFSFECLEELKANYTVNEKCVIIGIHELEFKKKTYGIITYNLSELSDKINMSLSTLKRTLKSLEDKGAMITKNIPGQNGIIRQVDYKKIFQDILYTKEKVQEHDIEINSLKEELAIVREELRNARKEQEYLKKQLEDKNPKSFSFE